MNETKTCTCGPNEACSDCPPEKREQRAPTYRDIAMDGLCRVAQIGSDESAVVRACELLLGRGA